MNAIISLCNFCEVHGPHAIFSTQTLRDYKINEIEAKNDHDTVKCPGCTSIGTITGIVSKDSESNANFLSTQKVVITDAMSLVKQAAIRSLSCEVMTDHKQSNSIFFGDSMNGYALAVTFQIHDSQARGLYRLFSIVVLMKEKLFLLNIQPFLVEHLNILIEELTTFSKEIHSNEESMQSERAIRLNNGEVSKKPPRSLVELTGKKHIYPFIHSHFAWILLMGARYLSENTAVYPSFTNIWREISIREIFLIQSKEERPNIIQNFIDESNDSLRKCQYLIGEKFESLCFCVLVGIQVFIRGTDDKCSILVRILRQLLPDAMHSITHIRSDRYLSPDESKLFSVSLLIAAPQPSKNIFRIDLLDDRYTISIKWFGELPYKRPNLLLQILKAVNSKTMNDLVLRKHVKVLVDKWKNNIIALGNISSNQDAEKLKKILGIQQQDNPLVTYWSTTLN